MRLFARIASLLRTLTRRQTLDQALDEELRQYLDHRIANRIAEGVPPVEARRRVLAEEGGIESIKEATRSARAGQHLADAMLDVRYGWRAMRRSPAHAAVAGLTLAVGIGANIAMFTVMRSVLWRPCPIQTPSNWSSST